VALKSGVTPKFYTGLQC